VGGVDVALMQHQDVLKGSVEEVDSVLNNSHRIDISFWVRDMKMMA
jgi:hypothetical protein